MIAILSNDLLELLPLFAIEAAGDGEVNRERIDGFVFYAEFVMEVRPGGPSGGAHIPDVRALRNFDTLFNAFGKALLVGIKGGDVVVVFKNDGVAVAALPAGKFHYTVRRRVNGRAARRRIVNAIVASPVPVNRVATAAKGRADSREL